MTKTMSPEYIEQVQKDVLQIIEENNNDFEFKIKIGEKLVEFMNHLNGNNYTNEAIIASAAHVLGQVYGRFLGIRSDASPEENVKSLEGVANFFRMGLAEGQDQTMQKIKKMNMTAEEYSEFLTKSPENRYKIN